MLELKSISIKRGAKLIADSLSFEAKSGELTAIAGPNGCGKTTLLHTVSKLIKPIGGAVLIDGKDTKEMSLKELSSNMGFLPQKTRTPQIKVFDLVLLGRKPIFGFVPKKSDFDKVEQILNSLNMQELADRECDSLSGGEFQKALLAKALAQEPRVMLLDEPTNHLDAKNRVEILSLFRRIAKEQGISVVAVLHDVNDALRFAERTVLLNRGELLFFDKTDMLREEHLENLYDTTVRLHKSDFCSYAIFGV